MTDAIKKLREPAALGAAAYAALSVLASVIELLFTGGGSFSDTAAGQTGNLLDFSVALALAIAVYLANHMAPALPKARLITLVALATAGAAALFGVVSFFAGFGASISGTDKFAYFLGGVGGAAALGVAGWYTWLTWQAHAPARPAAPAPGAGVGGGQNNWGGAPQGRQPGQGQPGQQQAAGPQGPHVGGFGWTPGNPNEQTAYLQPQAPANPQTLHAQQSATGSYSVPGGPGQPQPGMPGQPGGPQQQQQHGGQQAPQQPQQQPGPVGQPPRPPQGSGDRTQMMPPVPPTMQDYQAAPQPWQPGPGGAGMPPQQQQPQQPHVPQPGPAAEPRPGEENRQAGPFGVGNWQ